MSQCVMSSIKQSRSAGGYIFHVLQIAANNVYLLFNYKGLSAPWSVRHVQSQNFRISILQS